MNPLLLGIIIGAGMFGGPLGIIGWCLGHDSAMRKAGTWLKPEHKLEPELPPQRDRRHFPTTPGRSV